MLRSLREVAAYILYLPVSGSGSVSEPSLSSIPECLYKMSSFDPDTQEIRGIARILALNEREVIATS